MYLRTTSMGLSVSEISFSERTEPRKSAEFFFNVLTAWGVEYVFRYQRDAAGIALWHLYRGTDGDELPAFEARSRKSLATIPIAFTDADIDGAIRGLEGSPAVTTYVVIPGMDGVDFAVFPMSRRVASLMRTFVALADGTMRARIIHKMSQEMVDARCFTLDDAQKEQASDEMSEVGRLMSCLKKDGFYMYAAGGPEDPMSYVPPFIRLSMLGSSIDILSLEKRSQARNSLFLTKNDKPVARIDDVQAIFGRYEIMASSQKAMTGGRNRFQRREQDLLADWQRRHDDLEWAKTDLEEDYGRY